MDRRTGPRPLREICGIDDHISTTASPRELPWLVIEQLVSLYGFGGSDAGWREVDEPRDGEARTQSRSHA